MIRRTIGMLAGVAVLAAAGYGTARAEEAPAVDPKAKDALVQCGQYIQGLKSFRVQIATAMKMESEGMKQEFTMNTDLAVLRPNKLAMMLKGGMLGGSIVCDGTTVYTYVPSMGKYMAKPAPGKLEDLGADVVVGGGGSFPVAPALIAAKPDEAFLDGVTAGTYVGTEDVNGQPCHHVRFEQEQFTWDAWIQTGDKPLLLQIVPDLAKAFRKAMESSRDEAPGLKDMKAEMTITLADWKTDTDLPAELFAFTPPADAKKVDTFFGGEGMEEVEEIHPLQGQPAPAFKLPLLGEGELAVAELKDKNVVILDFWATWCGPCRRAMPVLAEVAQAFKDKGVVLYAVNQREEAKTIRDYLEKNKMQVTVALDKDGKVGQLYMVEGIPQSVIIGKDGLIKKVHVGFLPDLKARLTQELEEILSAAPAAPAAAAPAPAAPAAEPTKP